MYQCSSHSESAVQGGADLPCLTLHCPDPLDLLLCPSSAKSPLSGFSKPCGQFWIPELGSTLPPSQASGTLIRMQIRGCWSPLPHLPSSQIRNCCVERSRLVIRNSKSLGSILGPRQVPHLRGYSLSQSGSSCLLELLEDDKMTALEGWRPKVFFITLLFSCHPHSWGTRGCAPVFAWCSYRARFVLCLPCDGAWQRSCSVITLPSLSVLCYHEAKEVKIPSAKTDLHPRACGHSAVAASIPPAGQPWLGLPWDSRAGGSLRGWGQDAWKPVSCHMSLRTLPNNTQIGTASHRPGPNLLPHTRRLCLCPRVVTLPGIQNTFNATSLNSLETREFKRSGRLHTVPHSKINIMSQYRKHNC